MSPHLLKILNAIEKAESMPAKEKARLRKELEKEEKAIEKAQSSLNTLQRELKIEASLEVIRTRTMAMQSTDELTAVLSVLFEQYDVLGIHPTFAHLTLFNEANDTFSIRITGTSGQRVIAEHVIDMDSYPAWHESYEKWKKGPPGIVDCIDYPPEVVPAVFEIMAPIFNKLPTGSKIKAEDFSEGIYTTQGHCQYGYIGFNHTRRATEEEKEIVQKFAKEFGRLYQRFLDIQNAEAQVREAQIETALEKVRSRSLAMHTPNELQDVVTVVAEKLHELGVILDTGGVVICTYFPDSKDVVHWTASFDSAHPSVPYYLPYFDTPIFIEAWASKNSGADFFEKVFSFEEKNHFFEHAFIHSDYKNLPEAYKQEILDVKNHALSFAWSKNSALMVPSHNGRLLTEDHKAILKRFAKVLEQAYIRFMDLQKAEKQAREAQIEASLERIRARSMAMHSSEELNDVLRVMFQQVAALGIDAKCAHLTLMDLENNSFSFRITGKNGAANMGEQIIDLNAMPIWKETVAKWKKAKSHSHQCLVYQPEILPDLWKLIDASLKSLPAKERIKISDFPNGLFDCEGHNKFGYIGFNNSRPPTEEEIRIVIRFAREFERVYQRFLDIQKAEAQAREAQIEAALEKVRSRSLAMHSTGEMQQVANAVYEQLQELGVDMDFVGMSGVIEEKQDYDMYFGGASMGKASRVHYNEDTKVRRDFNKAITERPDLFTKTYSGKVKEEYFNHLLTQRRFPEALEKKMKTSKAFSTSIAFARNSGIQISRYTGEPYTEEENELLKRFAKVFEQAYIRFMDLEKAEAQAREAQIETALERVRSKTMAMHNSQDLEDIVISLFDEVMNLGLDKSLRCGIGILEGHEGMETRSVNANPDGTVELRVGMLNMTIHPMLAGLKKAWKKGSKGYSYEYTAKDVRKYYEALNKEPEYPFNADLQSLPEREYHKSFFYSSGIIFAFSENPISEESSSILARFAAVFGQTYRRFLDLQKAEAQAREAQIEAALERVRARTMAMHNTDDIGITVTTFFKELLGLHSDNSIRCGVGILSQSEHMVLWTASIREASHTVLDSGTLDMSLHPLLKGVKKTWRTKAKAFSYTLKGKDVMKYFQILNEAPDYPAHFDLKAIPKTVYHNSFVFSDGVLFAFTEAPLQEDIRKVLERFTSVFGQTYTRFLDLQKAEAQAREAQIEAALEKVRSQSLAMHITSEMQLVANAVFDQLQELGLEMDAVGMSGAIEAKEDYDVWIGGAPMGEALRIPYNKDTKVQRDYNKVIKERPELFARTYSGKVKEEYINHLLTHGEFPADLKRKMVTSSAFSTSLAFAENSGIQIARYTNEPYTEEENELLKRFAKVFEQAYVRFMDLQKAEVQAREAEIEAALERVRAASMAMHKTDELAKVVEVLFEQFSDLKLDFYQVWINIFHIEKGISNCWFSPVDGVFEEAYTAVIPLGPFEESSIKSWRAGEEFSYLSWSGLEKVDEIAAALTEMTGHPSFQKIQQTRRMDRMEVVDCNHKYGVLAMAKNDDITAEDRAILKRFTKVFEQAYTRFLDLKKAEEQAREAEIQLALERVRSRSMAMHSSEELNDVLHVFFQQFDILGIKPVTVFLSLFDIENNTFTYRSTGKLGSRMQTQQVIHLDSMDLWQDMADKWEKDQQDAVEVIYYPSDVLPELFSLFDETFSAMPEEERITAADFPDGGYAVHGYCQFGYIGFNHRRPPTEEEKNIMVRFGREFGQLYQRFLDVKKAEAQTRESEIQLTLERLRARTMAMKESSELTEVLSVVFQQLKLLGVETVWAHLTLLDLENDRFTYRMTGRNGERIMAEETIALDASDHWSHVVESLKASNPAPVNRFEVPPDGLAGIWQLFDGIFSKLPEGDQVSPEDFPKGLFTTQAYCKFGYLGLNQTREALPEEADILHRFATEFGRVYQRFLDLQQAEGQARESQIEAALEKVRSQSLAMHKTSEMQLVANAVFDQLRELGLEMDAVGMSGAIEAKEDYDVWIGGAPMGQALRIPFNQDTKVQRDYNKIIKERPELFARTYTGKIKEEYINHLLTHGKFPRDLKMKMVNTPAFSTSLSFAENSSIQIARYTNKPYTDEENELLKRFAKVFEQAYIRFMDIEKAEAQARESEIQIALERVRARSMGMNSSDELPEVLAVLFRQFDVLGIKPINVFLSLFNLEENTFIYRATGTSGKRIQKHQVIDLDALDIWQEALEQFKAGHSDPVIVTYYPTEVFPSLMEVFDETFSAMPEEERIRWEDFPNGGYNVQGYCRFGYIGFNHHREPTEEEKEILAKFATEFGRLYQRFLDLQKAEAQARESQIEAALEKVRSQSLAMHATGEMQLVANAVYEQLKALELEMDYIGMSGVIEAKKDYDVWVGGATMGEPLRIPYNKETKVQRDYNQVIKDRPELFAKTYSGNIKKAYITKLLSHGDFPSALRKKMVTSKAFTTLIAPTENSGIQIVRYSDRSFTEEEGEILKRFARIFEQAYIRFMDLQKAEAQAREAQIEAALERVRAASMAMHQTADIGMVVTVFFEQLKQLHIPFEQAWITILHLDEGYVDTWFSPIDGIYPEPTHFKMPSDAFEETAIKSWKSGAPFSYMTLGTGAEVDRFLEFCDELTQSDYFTFSQKKLKNTRLEFIEARHKYGFISKTNKEKPTREVEEILGRFAKVFEQSYTRFLDIEKAEKQSREAHIEAALEKVRSRSLAMQKPEELQEVVTVVGEKLEELGVILDSGGVVICTYYPDSKDVMHWTASFDTTHPSVPYYLPYFDTPIWKETWASKWETDDDFFEKVFSFEDKNHFFNKAFEISDYKNLPEEYKKELLAVENHALSFAWQTNSALMIASHNGKLLPGEHKTILKRFARVFEQAYIRFMDLQKAEAQARESKIEMALEKVRSRTMAMHKSEELGEVAAVLFEQISTLTYAPERFNIAIGNKEEQSFDIWVTDQKGHEVSKRFMFQVEKSPVVSEVFKAWGKKPYIVQELHGKKLQEWVRYMQEEIGLPFEEARLKEHRYINSVFFSHGCIGITTNEPPETEILALLQRFAKVFQQTYIRFLDLQKAEAQAKNAIKQASLDRVRGEIASMRSTMDLERITPLVWNELKALEIPFIRCGVFIVDEAGHTVQAFLSAPDGKSLGAMRIPFDADKDTAETVAHWKRNEVYRTHWDKKEFLVFMQSMKDLGQVNNEKEYQGAEQPPESLYLHFVPFTQGMMYVGNTESLDREQIEMVQSLADAFAIAYARYEDFVRLENAKESVETTLKELKATQNQLVQSEKMASLGELTAGIAHEIQNPLNFVNNFSEVSKELIEEMLEEMQKGDVEEVKALAEDIIQNLIKIHHHGQRADGIVKGMLQHSRSGSGEKEPTDINALCDEYLRLAYHGLRAKDKSFNATMETNFDTSVGKIAVVSQDIGRVILNLITNAFYAVKEKSSEALAKEGDKYQPTVTVSTKKTKQGIEISVKDNGNGIPEAIKEKIFQPFFTTKPTGQGTGLGLSMSYDIVTKGHEGELTVKSQEGKGTEFTIRLPVS